MKCLTLCCILVSCAYAADWTTMDLGFAGLQVGVPAKITAAVVSSRSDIVNEGTVLFGVAAGPVAHCMAVPVVGGKAECELFFTHSGEFEIHAAYTGTPRFGPSALVKNVRIENPPPAVYIAMAPQAPIYGDNLILNALVQDHNGVPVTNGTFTFSDVGVVIQSDTAVRGDGRGALVRTLNAGPHEIRARYNGNNSWGPAYTPVLSFTVAKGTPVVAVFSKPAKVGEPIVVSANVKALSPTGTVTFEGVPDCIAKPLEGGWAYCRTSYPREGNYEVIAHYSGDSNWRPGSASTGTSSGRVTPSLFAAVSVNSSVYGEPVLVGALAMGASWLPPPSGQITFTDESSRTGKATLDREGRGQWVSTFPAGVHRVTVAYAGDVSYMPATAATSLIVHRAATTTTLNAPAGGPVTATVAAIAPGAGYPTGGVRFFRDGEFGRIRALDARDRHPRRVADRHGHCGVSGRHQLRRQFLDRVHRRRVEGACDAVQRPEPRARRSAHHVHRRGHAEPGHGRSPRQRRVHR